MRPFSELKTIEYNYHDVTGSSNPLVARLEPLTYTPLRVDPQMCPGDFPNQNTCPVKESAVPPDKGDQGIDGGAKSNQEALSLTDFENMLNDLYSSSDLSAMDSDVGAMASFRNEEAVLWGQIISAVQWDTLKLYPREAVYEFLQEHQPDLAAGRFASALARDLGFESPGWVSSQNNYTLESEAGMIASLNNAGLPDVPDNVLDTELFDHVYNAAALVQLYHNNDKHFFPGPLEIEGDLPPYFASDSDKSLNSGSTEGNRVFVNPNPFGAQFFVDLASTGESESTRIVIHDILGKLIFDETFGSQTHLKVDGSKFPSGILIYTIYLDGVQHETGKIVKSE